MVRNHITIIIRSSPACSRKKKWCATIHCGMCSVDSRESLLSYLHIYVKDKDSARIYNLFQTVIKLYIYSSSIPPDNLTLV